MSLQAKFVAKKGEIEASRTVDVPLHPTPDFSLSTILCSIFEDFGTPQSLAYAEDNGKVENVPISQAVVVRNINKHFEVLFSASSSFIGGWGSSSFKSFPLTEESEITELGVQVSRAPYCIVDVKCSLSYALFLTETGHVYSSGIFPACAQEQHGTSQVVFPQPMKRVECGRTSALALGVDGQVYSWGMNTHGQLGREGDTTTPLSITLPVNSHAVDIAVGDSFGLILLETQGKPSLYNLGNAYGRETYLPVSISILDKILKISCGVAHCVAITAEGDMVTWGWGAYGQLGHGNLEDCNSPRKITALEGIRISSVASGSWHTACVSTDQVAYTWGWNKWGQLGHSIHDAAIISVPEPVEFAGTCEEEEDFCDVSCGARHTTFLNNNGHVYTCGQIRTTYGITNMTKLTKVALPHKVTKICAGGWSTLMVMQTPSRN